VTNVRRDTEPYAFRRHLRRCQFFGAGGREIRSDKCDCPFHVDGKYHGERVRQSLKTRSRQLADRRLNALLGTLDERRLQKDADSAASSGISAPQTVSEAVDRFLRHHGQLDENRVFRGDLEYATWRKYRTKLNLLTAFCHRESVSGLADVNIDVLEDYRQTRKICTVTWKVELQALRTFLGYCVSHRWMTANPAKEMKAPRNIKPNEVVPYSLREEGLILGACDQIGGAKYKRTEAIYERLRARAMVLLLRHTALRISDVCTFRKDAVSWDPGASTWRLLLRTQKTGDPVFLPIPENLKLVLDALPLPRNAAVDCPFFFWNGHTARRAVVGIAERTLSAVFKKSGVKNAHAHRFRHTLATRLLEQGATFEQVADILGNSPAIVRKHYGKWSKGRQDNIDRLMLAHFETAPITFQVTRESHENLETVN
jgi:site-specific recombinase XerD